MINLHIGSGSRDMGRNWENIDGGDYPNVRHHNVEKLDYLNNIVDNIYSSHLLSYFDREEVLPVLKEWHRVLKPNGNLYLSVPDFRAMAELYVKDNVPLHKFLGPLYGKMEMNGKPIFHKTVWDYASLGEYLRIAGFKRIEKWNFNELEKTIGKAYDDHSYAEIENKLISLNIKCKK